MRGCLSNQQSLCIAEPATCPTLTAHSQTPLQYISVHSIFQRERGSHHNSKGSVHVKDLYLKEKKKKKWGNIVLLLPHLRLQLIYIYACTFKVNIIWDLPFFFSYSLVCKAEFPLLGSYVCYHQCAVSYQNCQSKRREQKPFRVIRERPTRMSYPTWDAQLHMAMRHSCLTARLMNFLQFSDQLSQKNKAHSLSLSRFHQSFKASLACVTLYMYTYVLFYMVVPQKPTNLEMCHLTPQHLFSNSANKHLPV